MRTLVIDRIGSTRFIDRKRPEPSADEVLVDVRHVGLCGSDLNTYNGLNPLVSLPRIPGHEIGGVIVEAGENVPASFEPGRSVVVIPYTTCGNCTSCRQGRFNACRFNQTLGVQQDGCLSDVMVAHHDRLIVNDTLPPAHLALVEPLSVGFHAVARGRVSESDTVVVLGGGMIGAGAMLGALARGARVIAVEISAAKSGTLQALGVSEVLNPQRHEIPAEIERLTDGRGADVVIEAVGLPETFRSAVDLVSFGGRVVYVGYAKQEVSYNTSLFNLKELDILGSRNATREDFDAVIEFLSARVDDAERLISKTIAWADADQAFAYWMDNRDTVFKVMVNMGS